MKARALLLLLAGLLLGATTAPLEAQTPVSESGAFQTMAAGELAWEPIEVPGFDSGMEIAVVHGDPAEPGDAYTLRLRFPDGYRFPPHWHPVDENVTVIEGTFLLAMGERADESRLHRYAAGDYVFIESRHPHFGGAIGQTVIQLHGEGPFDIILVGSEEDRRE